MLDKQPIKTIYYYNQWQPLFEKMKKEKLIDKFENLLPTQDVLEKEASDGVKSGRGSLIIIDDFMSVSSEHIANIFTALSHHLLLSCIYISQNLFAQNNKYMRDMSLSATYLVVFKNPRDQSQIVNLAKQLAPGRVDYIINSFRELTSKPYSYVLYDLHQATPDQLRVRSNIFLNEGPIVCAVPI